MDTLCKCGSNKNYLDCCGSYITNVKTPSTPEQLMRSRYTAYAVCDIDYIMNTMHGKPLEGFDVNTVTAWAKAIQWLKLEVLNTFLESEDKGFVEFRAHYSENDQHFVLHEISEFHRQNGKWFYVDGTLLGQ